MRVLIKDYETILILFTYKSFKIYFITCLSIIILFIGALKLKISIYIRSGILVSNPYIKVTGCLSVCLYIPKDLTYR